jgi:hypothetical protein
VKFMIRNKGKDIGGYDLLLGGEKLDNMYNYPVTVQSGETVARVIDYDPNRYGKLKAFSFIPYSWEGALKRCSAAGLHYPAVPACS